MQPTDVFLFVVHDVWRQMIITDTSTKVLVSEIVGFYFHNNEAIFLQPVRHCLPSFQIDVIVRLKAIVFAYIPHTLHNLTTFLVSCDDALSDLSPAYAQHSGVAFDTTDVQRLMDVQF